VSSLLLAALHIAMVVTWLCLCSVLVARGSFLLARPKVQQLLQRASALLLIAFGVRILAALSVTPPG
jgi:threonine/homoserine/homoserine lactone efflux protein